MNNYKKTILFLFVIISSQGYSQSFIKITEDLLQEYNPQGYSYYKYGDGILKQGNQIASSMASQLSSYQELISATDPNQLLEDFNYKMQNIESLEIELNQQFGDMAINSGKDLINQSKAGDGTGALINALSTFGALSSMQEEARKAEVQKKALIAQKNTQMKGFLNKALTLNQQSIHQYLRLSAFSENIQDEKYYLEFSKHLTCYGLSMQKNYSASNPSASFVSNSESNTNWLTNNCAKPQKPLIESIENKFISKDKQYSNIAKKKYEFYLQNKQIFEFRDGAISFAAAAANLNPKAEYYYQLGEYYSSQSTILSLTTQMTAKKIDPAFFDADKEQKLQNTQANAAKEISNAIEQNNTKYLNAFLEAGLDKTIQIDNKSLLVYAISLDKPDAMQLILNKYVDGVSPTEMNRKLQKTIMLCAIKDSPNCIQRFMDLGIDMNFQMNKYSPMDVAVKTNSLDIFELLLKTSNREAYYLEKYKSTYIVLFREARINPISAADKINAITSKAMLYEICNMLIEGMDNTPNYFVVLENSTKVKSTIKANIKLNNDIRYAFAKEINIPSPKSKAHRFLKSGLVELNAVPLLKELLPVQKPVDYQAFLESGINWESIDLRKKYAHYSRVYGEGGEKHFENFLEGMRAHHKEQVPRYKKWLAEFKANKIISTELKAEVDYYEVNIGEYKYKDENIAYLAFKSNNYELFQELDLMYDLSEAQNSSGISVLESMLKSRQFIGKNPAYLSKDFKGNVIDKQEMFFQILYSFYNTKPYKNHWSDVLESEDKNKRYLLTVFEALGISLDKIKDKNGPILHKITNTILKDYSQGNGHTFNIKKSNDEYNSIGLESNKKEDIPDDEFQFESGIYYNNIITLIILRELGIDTKTVDSSGHTAWEHFVKNEQEAIDSNPYVKAFSNTKTKGIGFKGIGAKLAKADNLKKFKNANKLLEVLLN